jgi:hypothetical protein
MLHDIFDQQARGNLHSKNRWHVDSTLFRLNLLIPLSSRSSMKQFLCIKFVIYFAGIHKTDSVVHNVGNLLQGEACPNNQFIYAGLYTHE